MILIDEIVELGSKKTIGVEISIGDDVYFISGRQDLYRGVQMGKFPDVEKSIVYVGILTFKDTTEGISQDEVS